MVISRMQGASAPNINAPNINPPGVKTPSVAKFGVNAPKANPSSVKTSQAQQSAQAPQVAQSRPTETKTSQAQPPETQNPQALPEEDTVVISTEAKDKSKAIQDKLDEMRNRIKELMDGLQQAREASEGAAEMWKEKIRCLQIAMRIMAGDKVPEGDHRYLREKDAELYAKAITMRKEKDDPKEYDRLSEDEEESGEGAETDAPKPPTDSTSSAQSTVGHTAQESAVGDE